MNLLSFVNAFILFACCAAALVSARSLADVIGDAMHNGRQQNAHPENATDSVEASRTKRQASSACPVRKDDAVIVDGQETYLGFDENEPRPALFLEENLNLDCPASTGTWWPGVEDNLSGLCPWKRVTLDMQAGPYEIYPRYVTSAKCICEKCVSATANNCREIRRKFTFYRKTGCQGSIPILQVGQLDITIGCFCQKA